MHRLVPVCSTNLNQLEQRFFRDDIHISSRTRFEHGNEKAWIDVETYFTGRIYNAGGKHDPNIHVDLGQGRTICVDATEKQLADIKDNVLFKTVTLGARAEEHLLTRAIRNLQLIEFLPHSTEVDDEVLATLWKKGSQAWKNVESATDWVESIRGNKADSRFKFHLIQAF
jgi:hypothetical protein